MSEKILEFDKIFGGKKGDIIDVGVSSALSAVALGVGVGLLTRKNGEMDEDRSFKRKIIGITLTAFGVSGMLTTAGVGFGRSRIFQKKGCVSKGN